MSKAYRDKGQGCLGLPVATETLPEKIARIRKRRKATISDWPQRKGKELYRKYLDGGRLSASQAVAAKCYECLCGGMDGRDALDCQIYDCALYPLNPWQKTLTRANQLRSTESPVMDEEEVIEDDD